MFGRKRNKAIQVTKLSSLVADNIEIVGDVVFSGGLRVDGRIEGNVLGKEGERSLLVVSNRGAITGRVRVHDAVVNGRIDGDLEVEHFLELQASAHISGHIIYRQLQMDCGAVVDGQLEKVEEATVDKKVVDISVAASLPGRANEQ